MSVPQQSRNRETPHLHLPIQLLLFAQLWFCLGITLMERTVSAVELPAELMLEGVSLLKSMEYAKEKQQHLQSPQKTHLLHELAKRFAFNPKSTASADIVDIDGMQSSALSPGDISRFERELFLQSAIDDDDDSSLPVDDVELPLMSDRMEHADLMERAIDYKQHQPSTPMWLQQHKSSGGGGGDGKTASSTFLKIHQKQQQQRNQQKQHQKHAPHLNGAGAGASTNSVTVAPPTMPVAEPQRRCAIEISTKLTGVCQAMAPIGAACVAGDYMDVYNQDCM